ncbi:MAG: hypothetical protein E7343_06060 [Clostridiales bacterium]|nr:hypothetical protein [Clostridiales bacterium]
MTKSEKLFGLLRVALCAKKLDEYIKTEITIETLAGLFKLAKKHDLAHIVGDALDKNGLLPENSQAKKVFLQERNMAVYRYEQINYEYNEVLRVLNEKGIKHIPLKGSVIRAFYPEPWLRTSCDIDILVQEKDIEQCKSVLAQELGYAYSGECSHDVQFFSPSGVHLELHFTLLEEYLGKNTAELLNDVWSYATPIEKDSKTFALTNEMFYFYHIAHMAKHFQTGGCGIKPFMDIFIMETSMQTDNAKRDELLKKGGLLAFADKARELSNVWFAGASHTETTELLEEFVLVGGVYGTMENKVVAQQAQRGGKFRYTLSRIFQPYDQIKCAYPVLEKHKWLTPFYQVVRWFRILFKGRAGTSIRELNTNANVSKDTQDKTQILLKDLGLM